MRFSIIIATRNRPAQLADCLASIQALNFPPNQFEVIVADDGSDPAVQPVPRFASVRILRQQHGGPGAARNLAARHAAGQMLAFTDDDCRPRREWLAELDARLSSGTAAGGRIFNGLPENRWAAASQVIHDFLYQQPRHFNTNNLAVPREDFLALGGFDPSWQRAAAEDVDFCERWIASGRTLVYVPNAIVDHFHQISLRGFWRQHYGYGRGARWLRARHAWRRPPSFQRDLIQYAFSRGSGVLVLMAQFATAAGFLRQPHPRTGFK